MAHKAHRQASATGDNIMVVTVSERRRVENQVTEE